MADLTKNMKVQVDTAGGVASLRALQGAFNGVLGIVGLVVAVLGALTLAGIKAGKAFIEFERSVIKINTLLPKTDRATADVEGKLLELKKALPNQEVEDLSAAMYDLTSFTGDTAAALELAKVAGDAAIGTNSSLTTTTTSLIKTMKSFNLTTEEGKDFMDEYVAAVNSGVITGEKLGANIGESAIAMADMGGTTAEVLALYSTLAPALEEEAIKTGLKGVWVEMVKNKEELEEAGVATENFSAMLDSLEGKDIGKIFGRGETLIFLQQLLAQRDEYTGLIGDIEDSAGAAKKAREAYDASTAGIFDAASASVDEFTILAGKNFANIGAALITSMTDAGIEEVFDTILGVIGDMTPILVGVASLVGDVIVPYITDAADNWKMMTGPVSEIFEILTDIGKSLGLVKEDTKGTGGFFSTIVEVISFIFMKLHPVKLLVEAILISVKNSLKFWAKVFEFVGAIKEAIDQVVEGIVEWFEETTHIGAWFKNAITDVKEFGKAIDKWITSVIREANRELGKLLRQFRVTLGLKPIPTKKDEGDTVERKEYRQALGYTKEVRDAAEVGMFEDTAEMRRAFMHALLEAFAAETPEELLEYLDQDEIDRLTELGKQSFNIGEAYKKTLDPDDEDEEEVDEDVAVSPPPVLTTSDIESQATERDIQLREDFRERMMERLPEGIEESGIDAFLDAYFSALRAAGEEVFSTESVEGAAAGYSEEVDEKEREKQLKEGIKGTAKTIKESLSTSLIKGIRDKNVLKALKEVFLVQLGDMVMKAIIDAVLGALASAIVMAIINLLTGGAQGAVAKAFAKGGYLHDNKVHYAADGLFLANRTGANVLRHRPGGVPVIAAEAGVDEVNAFAPLNDTGFRLMMDEVMPLFPQFSEQMRGLGTMASQSFVYGARAQEAILGSMTPTFLVDVNPLLGSTVDVAISEAAQRGSRIKSSRTTN